MAKNVATRTCIACGKSGGKRDFARIVRTPEGEVVLDLSGRMPGRGAYLCKDGACFDTAERKRLLDARLRTKVRPERYGQLRDEFRDLVQDGAQAHERDGD